MTARRSFDLPDWLEALARAAMQVSAKDLTRWMPPEGVQARSASVLILFGGDDTDETPRDLLLLERSHDMRSHPGQVAFPGGMQDLEDADAVAAALREAEEETGLDPSGVTVFGVLPSLWLPPSNFAVTPVLGWWHAPTDVHAVDPAETASVHRVPLAELLDPSNRLMVTHPSGFIGPAFTVAGLMVWGFTAGLLTRIFQIVGWERAWDTTRVEELPDEIVESTQRHLDQTREQR